MESLDQEPSEQNLAKTKESLYQRLGGKEAVNAVLRPFIKKF